MTSLSSVRSLTRSHATFNGRDAQLEAAVKHLQELIAKDPRPVPPTPKYPDKSFKQK